MRDLPNPFWAALFVAMACTVGVVALFSGAGEHLTTAVLALSTNIITGAFAYIQGHKDGVNSTQQNPPPDNPAK